MEILKIDMTSGEVTKVKPGHELEMLGGRALTSHLINQQVPALCDPLGKENLLIFSPGLLAATSVVNTGRLSIGAKSPLTGGIKESNAGGVPARAMAKLGIKAVVIEGKPKEGSCFHLVIDKEQQVHLIDASGEMGKGTYQTVEAVLKNFGEKNAVLAIGPAGEKKMLSASIQSMDPSGKPSRSAARGGLGAVMGSKGLKSLVISTEGTVRNPISDKDAFQELSRRFASSIKSDGWSGSVLPDFGTASILSNSNFSGALPTMNAREGVFENADKISGDAVADRIKERGGKRRHKGCSKCIINCSNVFVDKEGKEITSALEYETLWSMGAMLGIDDLDAIAQLDRLCDDIGLDSMNTGVAVAIAMDAGVIEFGDSKAAIELVKSVRQENELGRLIGDGPDAVGKHLNHSRVPTVKGQSIAGYDPRAMPGMGVTYATSPMGADHTAGFVGGVRGSVETLLNTSLSSPPRGTNSIFSNP